MVDQHRSVFILGIVIDGLSLVIASIKSSKYLSKYQSVDANVSHLLT